MNVESILQPIAEEFFLELRLAPDAAAAPVHSEAVDRDLADLVDETLTAGVLAGQLPQDLQQLSVEVRPIWSARPVVEQVEVALVANCDGTQHQFRQAHRAGRWTRRASRVAQQLKDEGTVGDEQVVYRALVAKRREKPATLRLPPLRTPTIVDQSLEEFGVRKLGEGSLVADRPILVNRRMLEELLVQTEQAGAVETGSALLGKILRLPEPLPGTTTRVVTVLSASIVDPRHASPGALSFTFDPDGLAAAAEMARLRGQGESVQTVFHSHGFGTSCGNCNQNEDCLLPQATHVSLDDYQVLESLCPSKSTVLPIAGRKLGAAGRRPVLVMHAWRGGQMRALRYQTYDD